MKSRIIASTGNALSLPVKAGEGAELRSAYERFAIPYSFKPQLSFAEAVVAAIGAFIRVFLGCLLFAVWGSYSLFTWSAIRNPLLRVAAELPMFLLFVITTAALMIAITSLVKSIRLRLQ